MECELISKRELLSNYGISYGALYRWKRQGLIPEEWFVKKATVTGQETFFPRALICERVELIQRQKEDVSLSELSMRLSNEACKNITLTLETVFGKKTFLLSEIKKAFIDYGKGEVKDITEIIGGNK